MADDINMFDAGKVRDEHSLDAVVEVLHSVVPKRLKKAISKDVLQKLEDITTDVEERKVFKENVLRFSDIYVEQSQEGGRRFSIEEYVNATIYVSYKLMGKSNVDAYKLTFPDRMLYYKKREFPSEEKRKEHIRSMAQAYNRTLLVTKLMEQSLVPSYVIYQDLNAAAINKMASLMSSARSEKVQLEAAVALEKATAMPAEVRIMQTTKVGMEDNVVDLYHAALQEATRAKLDIIRKEKDIPVKEVINIPLRPVEDDS